MLSAPPPAEEDVVVREAIKKHDELADTLFVDGHDALGRKDYFFDPFTYGRWRIRQQLDEHLPAAGNGMRLLDIGCGTGEELGLCKPRGYAVAGLEPAAEMRRIAAQRHPEIAERIREGSIYEMPFGEDEFDYVLSIEVMRYLEDFPRAACEVARVLRPGGKWLFTVTPPTNWTFGPSLNRIRCAGVPLPFIQKLRMFWHSASYLRQALPQSGYSVEALVPVCYTDLPTLVLHDIVPGASSAWMRLWHPVWEWIEQRRALPWAAGYYFVVAQAGDNGVAAGRQ